MSYKMKLVVLTKSAKHGGFCVAGINLYKNKNWFARIVKNDDGDAVTSEDIDKAKPLDIIEVFVKGNKKKHNQTENFPIDFDAADSPAKKIGHKDIDYVKDLYNRGLFEHIGFFGNNKKSLTEEEIDNLNPKHSLSAIKVSSLRVYKNSHGKPKAEVFFKDEIVRDISMTDPDYDPENKSKIKNNYPIEIGEAILIVSLPAEPYEKNGRYYKFIAKIFEL